MLEHLSALASPSAALLAERGQHVAVADGATGGLISAAFASIPGATAFFSRRGTLYSLQGRAVLFGLAPDAFDGVRGVSDQYSLLQAHAIRDRFETDWAIAESGSAGPGKHPHGVEAGISCVAIVGPGVSLTRTIETGSTSRLFNMNAFAEAALTLFNETLAQGMTQAPRRTRLYPEQRFKQISDVACRLALEHGLGQMSFDMVAEAAAVTRRTVYNYFPSKDDLALHVIGEVSRRAVATGDWDDPTDGNAGDYLAQLCIGIASRLTGPAMRDGLRILVEAGFRNDAIVERATAGISGSFIDKLVRKLEMLEAKRLIAVADKRAAALALSALINLPVHRLLLARPAHDPLDETIRAAITMTVQALCLSWAAAQS